MDPVQHPPVAYAAVAPFLAENNENISFIWLLLCPIRSTPRCLRLELCGVKLVHPVYAVDYPSPIIIGFDTISAARLVIDAHQRVAYSNFNFAGHQAKPM